MSKRILAIVLSVALLLSVAPFAMVFSASADTTYAATYYMTSVSRGQEGEDGSKSKPFSTMDALIDAVNASGYDTAGNKIQVLVRNDTDNWDYNVNGKAQTWSDESMDNTAQYIPSDGKSYNATLVFNIWDKRGDGFRAFMAYNSTKRAGKDLKLVGPTEFHNIRFVDGSWGGSPAGLTTKLDTNGYSCVIDNCIMVYYTNTPYRGYLFVSVGTSNTVKLEGAGMVCKAYAGSSWGAVRNAAGDGIKETPTYSGYGSLDLTGKAGTYAISIEEVSFNLTKVDGDNYTINLPAATAKYGSTVNLDITVDAGYTLKNYKVNGDAIEGSSFTMPAEDVEVTADVEYSGIYAISTADGEHYTVTAPAEAAAGDTVRLNVTTDAGYYASSVTVNGTEIPGFTFTMPAAVANVVITVSPTLTATPDADGYVARYYYTGKNNAQAGENGTTSKPFSNLDALVDAINRSGYDVAGNRIWVGVPNNQYCYSMNSWDWTNDAYSISQYTHAAGISHKATVCFNVWDKRGDNEPAQFAYGPSERDGVSLKLVGPTEFKNIRFVDGSWGTMDTIQANGYSLVIDDCVFMYYGNFKVRAAIYVKVAAGDNVVIKGTYKQVNANAGTQWSEVSSSDVLKAPTYSGVDTLDLSSHPGTYALYNTDITSALTKVDGTGYTINLPDSTAKYGSTVTLGISVDTGYTFKTYKVNGDAIEGSSFTMPAEAVEVTADVTKDASEDYTALDEAITDAEIPAEDLDDGMKDLYDAAMAAANDALKEDISKADSDAAIAALNKAVNFVKNMKVAGAALTLYNDLTVRYLVDSALLPDGLTNLSMHFSIPGEGETDLWAADVDTYTEVVIGDVTYYSFAFDGLLPSWVGETIKCTVSGELDSVAWSLAVKDYSVKNYCMNILGGESVSEESKGLMTTLMNYSQMLLNYVNPANTSNLLGDVADALSTDSAAVNGIIANYTAETYTNSKAIAGTVVSEQITWKGAALNLAEDVTMKIYFQCTGDLSKIAFQFTDGENTYVKDEVYQEGEYYVVEFDELDASEFSTVFDVVAVGEHGNVVSKKLSYSVESYAAAKANGGNALANLVIALMAYGNAAAAYNA